MTIRELNREEVTAVYKARVMEDFPPDERRPLRRIKAGMKDGRYVCYGLFDGVLLGYAFFVRKGGWYLMDYLATEPAQRNRGLGAVFLGLLRERLSGAECVLLEAEAPETAREDAERTLRQRRLDFYLRNGVTDTGLTAKTFGVDYRILRMNVGQAAENAADRNGRGDETEKLRTIYRALYRAMMPEAVCRMMVKI